MAVPKKTGSGWHKQSVRHSNARKYGRAGGKYSKYHNESDPDTFLRFRSAEKRDEVAKDLQRQGYMVVSKGKLASDGSFTLSYNPERNPFLQNIEHRKKMQENTYDFLIKQAKKSKDYKPKEKKKYIKEMRRLKKLRKMGFIQDVKAKKLKPKYKGINTKLKIKVM